MALFVLAAAGSSHGVHAQDEQLPEGPGRVILATACSSCHELKEVTKFKGYYDAAEWRDLVVTMIKYGAQVKDKDVDVLVEYLARNFGRKP
jgi:hypothetical protein